MFPAVMMMAFRTLAFMSCLAPLALGGCAPSPTGTLTPTLGAHQPSRVLGAQVVGRVPADEPIDLVIGLKLRDADGLARLLRRQADPSSGDFRRWLRPAEFADAFGATAEAYDDVARTFEAAGFTIVRRTDGRSALTVRAAAAAVERFFGTELLLWHDARRSGGDFRAPSSAFVVPQALASMVDTVVGLDDANGFFSHRQGFHPGDPEPAALPGTAEPADLRTLYNVNAAKHPVTMMPLQGANETVAILGTGYSPSDNDMKGFVTKYALPTNLAGQYVRVALGGQNRDPVALATDEYYENVLDADMVLGIAPMANVVHVFTASNAPGLFSDGIAFVVNQVPQAHAVSVSYGSCERVAIYEALQLNAMFQQAKAQGQAWFFASGDNGTDACKDGSSDGVPGVDWPASSPYVIGVGGTAISSGGEIAWFAGGGGESELFPRPSWQAGVGPYPDNDARDVPDVAALAGDPGVATIVGTSIYPEQGTSAATPIWAAIWALVDEARDNVGMSDYHERLYALAKMGTGAFHDITSGTNSDGSTPGYSALPGFDLATGWGTPDLVKLVGGLP